MANERSNSPCRRLFSALRPLLGTSAARAIPTGRSTGARRPTERRVNASLTVVNVSADLGTGRRSHDFEGEKVTFCGWFRGMERFAQ